MGCRRMRRAFLIASLVLAATAMPVIAAETEESIVTPGVGVLTMCRSWVVYTSCSDYNHVVVPGRVKIGDSLDLVFGSNTKKISFPVVRITQQGDRCTVYNSASGTEKVDKIELQPCRAGVPPP